VAEEEWAAVCRHVKAVEEEYMSKEHEIDSAMERILINPDDDDDTESSDDCDDQDMIGVGLLFSDSE
jgi:hypothetical protein